ncbi:hypothetical protein [Dictyobacter vulcani]|uniref:hypothetical protein n=1 Tax=Dictyobacter vulcani TaxID=2607529 RepID=UPI001E5FD957|nr:hypothetical protein [Dictyobacter vulcani]
MAVLALTGTTFLAQHLAFRIVLGIVGSIFLLHLAWVALHTAFIPRKQVVASPHLHAGISPQVSCLDSPTRSDWLFGQG